MDRGRLRSLSKECSGSVARDLQYSVYIHKMMSDASGVDNSTCGISAAVVVGLLHEEPEPIQWKGLHVRALRGINCERMQTLLTNVLLRLWGVAVLGFFMYQTAFADSLDALMACDVCQGFRCSFKISTSMGIHRHDVAAFLEGMKDVRGSDRE